ncbi:hypothetical protein CCACVL1_22182 [Corchorus capsularis]|uniref:Response regulatory domain-containing protein n=1 Tax=Corchorus capsularis TaxID=210143 RepID=A0A1R3H0M3_COCAP|nr:hypothetical protein CCACVL1_22182 [Corchorus capsularis]
MNGNKIIQKSSILKNSLVDNGSSSSFGGFPAGLKILIVDDDRTCLLVLERMLRKLLYQVTKCQLASDALAMLRADKSRFDIVICDLHMPDMDGFKLLEIIRSEMDLPVVMMSSDDEKGVVMRGIIHGACDYLVKPIRIEAIRFIWQHVVRRKKCSLEELEQKLNNDVNRDRLLLAEQVFDAAPHNANSDRLLLEEQVFDAAADHQMSNGESLKLQDQEDGDEDDNGGESYSDGEGTTPKKRRMIWTKELHNLFIAAINQLGGLDQSVPKKILERMKAMNPNIYITRANIGSHLQKYRINLRKLAQPSADHNKNIYVNALFEHAASSFRQESYREAQPISHPQLALQNLIAPQSTRFEPKNETVAAAAAASTSDNGIAGSDYQSLISELSLPAEFSLHGLSRANSLQQYDFPGAVPIYNDEHLFRSVGNFTDLLSETFPTVDDLILEPSFPVSQYDLESIFR